MTQGGARDDKDGPDANTRATGVWTKIVARSWRAPLRTGRMGTIGKFIARRTAVGGASAEG